MLFSREWSRQAPGLLWVDRLLRSWISMNINWPTDTPIQFKTLFSHLARSPSFSEMKVKNMISKKVLFIRFQGPNSPIFIYVCCLIFTFVHHNHHLVSDPHNPHNHHLVSDGIIHNLHHCHYCGAPWASPSPLARLAKTQNCGQNSCRPYSL